MSLRDVPPNRLVVDMRVAPGYEPCRELFLMSWGGMKELPRLLGMDLARVQMTELERGVRLDIEIPPEFIALYRSGEASGQLESNLLLLAEQNQEKAQRALSLASVVYPGLALACVAVGVAYFVFSIYGGYLKMLTGLADP
jgi:hypothetical protein